MTTAVGPAPLTHAPAKPATGSWLERHGPFWLSLVAGVALWEIAGRNVSPAFLVPLSETLVRLWELTRSGQLGAQFLDSALLFITGFAVALAVGMPAGLLLARVRALRVGLEPYIMMLYA